MHSADGYVSETDMPIQHDGSEDEDEDEVLPRQAVGRKEAPLNAASVREDLLDYLDELYSAEDIDSEEEEVELRRAKYHHILWRSRCWRGELIHIPRKSSPRAAEDTLRYRLNYPDLPTGKFLPCLHAIGDFYQNKRTAHPYGDTIDVIHTSWWGKYSKLETQTNYIEWLFPIREIGTNWHAQDLQIREIKCIIEDWQAHHRVFTSYEMMLDFYGMKFKDHSTGELQRAPGWRERFKCFNKSSSCHRHITRIFKCLGELNHEKYKVPFVEFILHEAITEGTLPQTLDSCMEYWVDLIRSGTARRRLRKMARHLAREHNRKIIESRQHEEEDTTISAESET